MKQILAFAFVVALFSPFAAQAAGVKVDDVYSFAVLEGAKTGAAFMTITAEGDGVNIPDRLVKVSTPVAGTAEIHTTIIENDVMQMRPLDALPLSPLGTTALTPGGAHIMLLDLKKALVAGEKFPLELTFEKAGVVSVEATVRAPGDVPAPAMDHSEHEAHGAGGHAH